MNFKPNKVLKNCKKIIVKYFQTKNIDTNSNFLRIVKKCEHSTFRQGKNIFLFDTDFYEV